MRNKRYKRIAYILSLLILISAISINPASEVSAEKVTTSAKSRTSIKGFLETALQPMGTTMYIYGGGWNEEDTGAGEEARTIGLSEKWAEFAAEQTSSYNYKDYDYKADVSVIHLGLDCSGFAGWAIYNTLETENGKEGYVDYYNRVLERLENAGYGKLTMSYNVTDYKPGDIMKSNGHMWIVIGSCSDGSVVLLHSSPPGVMLSGTATPSGKKNSEANTLATYYMKTYYTDWYNRYPDSSRGAGYLTGYNQFRWDVTDNSENSIFTDEEGYQNMTASEVLFDLFGSLPDEYSEKNPDVKAGSWKKDGIGWWYEKSDGTYPKASWEKIDNVWYYFNKSGYMATGWQKVDGVWYYMEASGAMATGWIKTDGKWYYLLGSGAMYIGWIQSGDKWYYLQTDGSMAVSKYIGSYHVNSSGEWDN